MTPDRLTEIMHLAYYAKHGLADADDMDEGKRRTAAVERASLHAHEALTRIIATVRIVRSEILPPGTPDHYRRGSR